jgi:DNA-directed RNA polymerase subunit K/omega
MATKNKTIVEEDIEEEEPEISEEESASEAEEEASEAEAGEAEEDIDVEASASEAESEEEEASAGEAESEEEEEEASEGEGEAEEEGSTTKTKKKTNKKSVAVGSIADLKTKAKKTGMPTAYDIDNDEDEDDEEKEHYLQKFDSSLRDNFILNHHPEANTHNYEEVKALSRVTRDGRGIIIDPLHKTIPILTKYEMTRVIGQRAKQLDSGAKAFVKVPLNVIDGYHIAVMELEQKKLPFIIKRPYPNGGVEYWCVSDLEIL